MPRFMLKVHDRTQIFHLFSLMHYARIPLIAVIIGLTCKRGERVNSALY